jgi:hypothetical protein
METIVQIKILSYSSSSRVSNNNQNSPLFSTWQLDSLVRSPSLKNKENIAKGLKIQRQKVCSLSLPRMQKSYKVEL